MQRQSEVIYILYLKIILENLEKMWFIANATAKRDLIDEGVPLIAVILKGLSDSRKFFQCKEVGGLTALLNVFCSVVLLRRRNCERSLRASMRHSISPIDKLALALSDTSY